MASDPKKIEILYKKYLGVADAKPGTDYTVEALGSARPKIIPNLQVYAESIPSVAPVDLILDNTFIR